MVLTGNLQETGERLVIRIHLPSDFIRNVLVDQNDGDIFPFACKRFEGGLDGVRFGLRVYDQVVLLAVWRVGDVAYTC